MNAYFRPDTLAEALDVLETESVTVAAGCTDLFPATERPTLPGSILDITAIPGLRGVQQTADGWRIGATASWADIIRADLPPAFDMLQQAGREVGSVQIQTAGTIAGNLCNASPAADGVPPLLALDASVELTSKTGTRCLPLSSFVIGVRQTALVPGELVSAITIPNSAGEGASRFLKLGARRYLVISIAMVAVRLSVRSDKIASAAIAVGACSPVAQRLDMLEARLIGLPVGGVAKAITGDVVSPSLSPIDDVRGDAGYREDAAIELIQRAVTRAVEDVS
ncbi:FAD binding domain-containing protein [Phaeobacter marinintestinus]|uniref:FAD binding domain-containing protein n=1 Tax=Falsiphaeobacter marinintestinus TaxID=1492905 RepID=UPI0011B4CAD2|nr:FAD binding domain-containing protein [Phaeobacter marinintestinus]